MRKKTREKSKQPRSWPPPVLNYAVLNRPLAKTTIKLLTPQQTNAARRFRRVAPKNWARRDRSSETKRRSAAGGRSKNSRETRAPRQIYRSRYQQLRGLGRVMDDGRRFFHFNTVHRKGEETKQRGYQEHSSLFTHGGGEEADHPSIACGRACVPCSDSVFVTGPPQAHNNPPPQTKTNCEKQCAT